MEGTMKQLIFRSKGNVELVEVPIPSYGDDGVLVKVAYAGICGSDIHAYTKGGIFGGVGDNSKFGHEFAGTIVEVGKNVTDFKVGDRVWVHPDYSNKEGGSFSCMAGGFAEYCGAVSAVKDVSVFAIPDDIPLRSAALIEPFGVGVHTKNRAGVKAGDKVVMWGVGPIGLMGWAAMRHQGVDNIVAAERLPERVELARKLGVDVFDNTEITVTEYATGKFGTTTVYSDQPDRVDVDCYLDYAGVADLVIEYMEYARPQSTFSTLSLDRTPETINPGLLMMSELSIKGSRSYTSADIAEVIEVLQDKSIDIASIITGEFTLDEATEAFETACDRRKGLKVLFRIGGE